MTRPTRSLAVLILAGFGLVGCDGGGIKEGTPPEAQGNVLPPGFEDMQKKQDAAKGKPAPKAADAKAADAKAADAKVATPK